MAKPKIKSDGRTITVRVPISIKKRGGRKVVLAPDGSERDLRTLRCQHIDNAMVKALARAFRWREMLENGTYTCIAEIAAVEKLNESYVGRVLRLTLLAPDVVEAIVNGAKQNHLTLSAALRPFPMDWKRQRETIAQNAA